jgi:hypothetical protein
VDAPGVSLCRCATHSGRLSCAQILEATDSIGVTRFLCRILDTDFGKITLLGTWVNKAVRPLTFTNGYKRVTSSCICERACYSEYLQITYTIEHGGTISRRRLM